MTAPSQIFLHIGLHKTGTSTLQEYLYAHRDRLLAHSGVYFPGLQANLSRPLSSLFHDTPESYSQNVLHGVDSEEKVAKQNARLEAELNEEFARCSAEQMLISGEDVCLLSHDALSRLATWLEQRCDKFTVVCVLRDPAAWSTSAAQSRIRGGETLAEVNADHRVQRLKPLLETIAGAFGHERVRWLDFQQLVSHPDNYITAFLEALGLDAKWTRKETVRIVNESISMEAAQLVSAINTVRPLYREGKLNPERWANDIGPICDGVPGRRFRLEKDTLLRIHAEEQALLDWLQQSFGFCFSPEPGSRETTPDDPGQVTLSEVGLEALALAMHDLEKLKLENAQLREKLAGVQPGGGADA